MANLQQIYLCGEVKSFSQNKKSKTITIELKYSLCNGLENGLKVDIIEPIKLEDLPTGKVGLSLEETKKLASKFALVDYQTFFDYYSARNWKINGNEIFDWAKIMALWQRRAEKSGQHFDNERQISKEEEALLYSDLDNIKI